jgi:hypothetical protein
MMKDGAERPAGIPERGLQTCKPELGTESEIGSRETWFRRNCFRGGSRRYGAYAPATPEM